ncbi:uncharacterized protein PRCAT00003034001 [Priceomyces carsonii]|uniref:uncharacterized protein n=1 Tax=Priceomyces carsonii TaxID=28549 RepID=UPI002ED994CE|nr:unnamed protein product [Priceomyces carsonii]
MSAFSSSKRTRDEFEADNGTFSSEAPIDTKKQHMDPTKELISNVCKDVRRIGENANLATQIDDISYISNPIVAEFEKIDNLRVSILNTFYALVIEQPQKITSLGNLVLICNSKNFVVAKYVVEFFHAKVQVMLDSVRHRDVDNGETNALNGDRHDEDAGAFNNIKSVLKFLATLSPLIEDFSIIKVFKQFLELAIQLQESTAEKRNGTAEEIYFNTLIALPYLFCNDFSAEMINNVNDLIEISKAFNIVHTSSNLLLQAFDGKLGNYDIPYEPKQMIDLILPSLLVLQGPEKDWSGLKDKIFLDCSELLRPIIEVALKNNPISSELVKHKLPQFSLPTIEDLKEYTPKGKIDELWYNNSRLLFQVYNSTEFETVPKIDSYFGLFFKDLAFDILTNLSFNKNETSIQLSILDLYFNKDLFAPPGSSIDQLSLIDKDNKAGENVPPLSTWKIEDIAVESILTMIFQLPNPLHHEIYYYTVLIACCRESPESIAPVFGRAIRYLYKNLETLDYELKIRFLDWMTTQISNFEFSWKWDEWIGDSKHLKNLTYHPKKSFIRNLIAKEVRLSNKNRIKESFVSVNPESNEVELLDEFYQYLNISLFEDETKRLTEYDVDLYGGDSKEIIEKIHTEKASALQAKSNVSPQDELTYIFSNSDLPLNDLATKVYEFIVASWKPNAEFNEFYKDVLTTLKEHSEINAERFMINLFFQTYAYIGSRSIYSAVSILSRDKKKLKFLSGATVDYTGEEPRFDDLQLTEEDISLRQNWIIESIFRIWAHQPQVIFLFLEYLIEFEILDPKYLITKSIDMNNNLIIKNVSCMESINRTLQNFFDLDKFEILILTLFKSIIRNLNSISQSLNVPNEDKVVILKDFPSDDLEVTSQVDNEWLFYEYKGLLKTYLRKFIKNHKPSYIDTIRDLFNEVENEPAKNEILTWFNEL